MLHSQCWSNRSSKDPKSICKNWIDWFTWHTMNRKILTNSETEQMRCWSRRSIYCPTNSDISTADVSFEHLHSPQTTDCLPRWLTQAIVMHSGSAKITKYYIRDGSFCSSAMYRFHHVTLLFTKISPSNSASLLCDTFSLSNPYDDLTKSANQNQEKNDFKNCHNSNFHALTECVYLWPNESPNCLPSKRTLNVDNTGTDRWWCSQCDYGPNWYESMTVMPMPSTRIKL